MKRLEKRVDQLQKSMDIIDGSNDYVIGRVNDLIKRINDGKRKSEEVQQMLQDYQENLEEQREMVKALDDLKKRLIYIDKFFPEGMISIMNEEDQELSDENKSEMHGQPKNLFNVPNKRNANDGKTISQGKEHINERTKNPHNTSLKNVLNGKLNVLSPQVSLHHTLNNSSHSSKCDLPQMKVTHDISVNYISADEYSQLPGYMRGRLTMANINEFIDTFNGTLSKKYELLKKQKKVKSKPELEQCLIWKEQEKGELTGSYFCTAEDFDKLSSIKIGNKKYLNIITILRHTKRMKEVRNMKVIYYVACF